MRLVIAVLLLSGCATTYRAQTRRQAESRFEACIGHQPVLRHVNRSPFLVRQCKEEVAAWCVENGLERNCWVGP